MKIKLINLLAGTLLLSNYLSSCITKDLIKERQEACIGITFEEARVITREEIINLEKSLDFYILAYPGALLQTYIPLPEERKSRLYAKIKR